MRWGPFFLAEKVGLPYNIETLLPATYCLCNSISLAVYMWLTFRYLATLRLNPRPTYNERRHLNFERSWRKPGTQFVFATCVNSLNIFDYDLSTLATASLTTFWLLSIYRSSWVVRMYARGSWSTSSTVVDCRNCQERRGDRKTNLRPQLCSLQLWCRSLTFKLIHFQVCFPNSTQEKIRLNGS